MTIEEIRKNAPEDATHYKMYGLLIIYYSLTGHLIFRYKDSEKTWVRCSMCDHSNLNPL